MQITPQFAAISFVTLVILANLAIHRIGDWLYPDPSALSTNLQEAI